MLVDECNETRLLHKFVLLGSKIEHDLCFLSCLCKRAFIQFGIGAVDGLDTQQCGVSLPMGSCTTSTGLPMMSSGKLLH